MWTFVVVVSTTVIVGATCVVCGLELLMSVSELVSTLMSWEVDRAVGPTKW